MGKLIRWLLDELPVTWYGQVMSAIGFVFGAVAIVYMLLNMWP